MGRKKVIDISTEKKKKEVFEKFNSFNSKNQAHEYFGISDNKQGSEYLKQIANEVGFELSVYKERRKKPIKYCKECGKEINSKWGKDFCCSSCAAKYNNKHRDKSVYEKVANKLKKNSNKTQLAHKEKYCIVCEKKLKGAQIKCCSEQCRNKSPKTTYKRICEFCGIEFETPIKNGKFCSNKCQHKLVHKMAYEDFLSNNDKYCRGNYTPKAFKKDFIAEQGGVCAICGCEQTHNGKPLTFVLDHIDGDASNNRRENLRMICPNCDSQLDTFKSKNKNSTRRNYWKEHILKQVGK
jgi:uncharacterized Zn ribbon protein